MMIHPLGLAGAFLAVYSLAKLKDQANQPSDREAILEDLSQAQARLKELEPMADPEAYETLKSERDKLANQLAAFESALSASKPDESQSKPPSKSSGKGKPKDVS